MHIAIGNLKAFLLGTYHGVSSTYLQEYLNEFCYRFNRRQWEPELPLRLLDACLNHTQIKLKTVIEAYSKKLRLQMSFEEQMLLCTWK